MKEWITKYWLETLFGAILTIMGGSLRFFQKKLKSKTNEQEAIKLGIQALLRDRLIQSYNHYIDKGFCPIYALDNINALYAQYHALGGNGTITDIVEKLKALPTEKNNI